MTSRAFCAARSWRPWPAAVSAPASAGELKLTMQNGRVTIIANNVPLRQILQEWARVGQTKIVNADKLSGPTVTLQLIDAPERDALDILLRSASGYIAAPRPAPVARRRDLRPHHDSWRPAARPRSPAASAAPPPTFQRPPQPIDDSDEPINVQMPPQMINPANGQPQNAQYPGHAAADCRRACSSSCSADAGPDRAEASAAVPAAAHGAASGRAADSR